MSEVPNSEVLRARRDAFCNTGLFSRAEVLRSPCPVPKEPGVYGWWFRRVPGGIDTSECLKRDGLVLLYTGISPRRPPSNGRGPSMQRLRDRVRYHYSGNAEGSTLRKTLGSYWPTRLVWSCDAWVRGRG